MKINKEIRETMFGYTFAIKGTNKNKGFYFASTTQNILLKLFKPLSSKAPLIAEMYNINLPHSLIFIIIFLRLNLSEQLCELCYSVLKKPQHFTNFMNFTNLLP